MTVDINIEAIKYRFEKFHNDNVYTVLCTNDYFNELIVNNRRAGNSTRIIDKAIQLLFKSYSNVVICLDHHSMGHERTFKILCDRLRTEHHMSIAQLSMRIAKTTSKEYNLIADRHACTIWWNLENINHG
jgi:hypothetical protein